MIEREGEKEREREREKEETETEIVNLKRPKFRHLERDGALILSSRRHLCVAQR